MPLNVLNRPRKVKSNISNQNHCVNRNNLIHIQTKKAIPETQTHNRLPTFFHSNIRSLNAKIDDLQTVTQQNNVDVIAITETWLNSRITDGPISFLGYSIVRNDRENGKRGRGVCAFIKSNIPFSTLPNLSAPDVVGVWLKLRPYQLPRKLSCIFIGMIYHPPLADNNIVQDYLISMVDNLLLDHPNTGIMILGDFNHFHYKTLCHHSFLKQTVKKTYPANSHFRFDLNQYAQMVQRTRNLTSVKYHCVFCREMEHKIESQFMSDLPQLRLAPCTPPFHHTACDDLGAFIVKIGRNKTTKQCGGLFTSLNTKAVHLELAVDCSTMEFLQVLRRFFSIRGQPAIMSDNATQFVGAERELREMIAGWDKKQLQEFCAEKGMEWKFITPKAPHQNGCAEAMVKTCKRALKKVVGDQTLTTFEPLRVFARVRKLS